MAGRVNLKILLVILALFSGILETIFVVERRPNN
jgi:uncharacterized membrane protein YqaE (UPF0057 family)